MRPANHPILHFLFLFGAIVLLPRQTTIIAMNFKLLLSVVVVGAGAFATGVWLGRHQSKPVVVPPLAAAMSAIPKAPASAPVKTAPSTHDRNTKWLTLAEVAQALNELKNAPQSTRWEKLRDLARSIDPALFPQALALVEKESLQYRGWYRTTLLGEWAKVDARAALAYAQAVKGTQERVGAVITVARVWAEVDATSALAWVQQLPEGQLRRSAMDTVVNQLAEQDPERALELFETMGNRSRG